MFQNVNDYMDRHLRHPGEAGEVLFMSYKYSQAVWLYSDMMGTHKKCNGLVASHSC